MRISVHLVTYLCGQLTDDLARGADRTPLMPLMPNKIGANIEYDNSLAILDTYNRIK